MFDGGRLVAQGFKNGNVSHLFTPCSGHIAPSYDACFDEDICVVDTRDEQSAIHPAHACVLLTRGKRVRTITAGPGETEAVPALANTTCAARRVGPIRDASPETE